MLNEVVKHTLPLLGAVAIPAYRYLGEVRYTTLEYYSLTRSRTATASLVLNVVAKLVSSVTLAKGIDRDELFERYDVKLWSFNDNLALFTLATIPSVAILSVIYASFRGIEAIRYTFGL